MFARTTLLAVLLFGFGWRLPAQTTPSLSLTPSSISFTFQIGATTLPAAQTAAVKRSGSGAALDFTVTVNPPAPWLIVTPSSGKTGTPITLRVNPSLLIAGTYLTVVQVDAVGSSGPATAAVALIVKNPPPTMAAAPAALSFAWQTDAPSGPVPQTISVTTNGEPISFTVASVGGTWLSVIPTVGVVVAGSPHTLTATVDTTGLSPGSYTGRITLTSLTAANKTIVIAVTLAVTPGTAVVSSVWPSAAPIGSNDTTITIRGSHLFKTSLVKANGADLVATWISTGVLLAAIPKASLTTQGTLSITVVNSPQPASNATNFIVTPPGPTIQSVVSAASFASAVTPVMAPGEIITIFGASLGPTAPILAAPINNGFPTTVGAPVATVVEFFVNNAWVPAPLIFVQANQINCQVPFTLVPGPALKMRVVFNALTSADYIFDGVAADPGIFTIDSSGRGQAAALNYNPTMLAYSLNSAANPVPKGGILILYLTGTGTITPLPVPEGELIALNPLPALDGTPSVTIGGTAASVISATAVPGAIGGLTQLNISVPTIITAGKDLSVVVVVSGKASPVTATVAVK